MTKVGVFATMRGRYFEMACSHIARVRALVTSYEVEERA